MIYCFTHLPLISTVPLCGGGCRSTPPPRGYDEGTAEWNNFDGLGGLGAPSAHALSFRNEQEGEL